MRKRSLVGWLLVVLIAGTNGKCGTSGGGGTEHKENPRPADTRPTCPDIAFRSPEERCLTIQTFVESRLGPYDVYIRIDGGNGAYPPHIPIASGGWKHSLVYRTGVKMTINVTLHYEGEKSRDGYCSITDANNYTKDSLRSIRAQGGSPYQAICTLHTVQ